MDRKIKKKKSAWVKIKKIARATWKEFLEFVKKMYKNFMALPTKVRYIVYIWFFVILLILILIIGSVSSSKFMNEYVEIENTISKAALEYIEYKGIYPVKDNELILDMEVLKDSNYLEEDDITDNTCSGFSAIYYKDVDKEYVVKSYINCKKYTTKGYLEYKK